MPSMRVNQLAKEYGLSSKEMLEKLRELKIPAKSHASVLAEPYVDKARKALGEAVAAQPEEGESAPQGRGGSGKPGVSRPRG